MGATHESAAFSMLLGNSDLLVDFTESEKHEKLYNQESQYLAFVIQTVKDVGRSYDLLVDHYNISTPLNY